MNQPEVFTELKVALEQSLAHDYAELVWLLVDHRAVIDPMLVLASLIGTVEFAIQEPSAFDLDADDSHMLPPLWVDLNALKYAWDGDLSRGELA